MEEAENMQARSDLFRPAPLGPYQLANRIVMAPLTRSRAGEDGVPRPLEPIREVWIHDEAFAASRLSMMRIMARRMKATAVVA